MQTASPPASGIDNSLPDLTAVQAVALLCARNVTAVEYVNALNDRYVTGGFSCNNPWITYNITQVCTGLTKQNHWVPVSCSVSFFYMMQHRHHRQHQAHAAMNTL